MVIWLRTPRLALPKAARSDEAVSVGVDGGVIRREDLGMILSLDEGYQRMRADRDELLAAARERAVAIIAAAQREADRLRADAQRENEEAARLGYEEGIKQATEEWFARSAQVAAERKSLQASLRERMAEVVVAAVEQITRHEDRSVLFARAVNAVERLVDGGDYLKVRVHPDDYPTAQREFTLASAGWNKGGRLVLLSVTSDRALKPGSCICESDLGMIDASLEVQLNAVRAAVMRAVDLPTGARPLEDPADKGGASAVKAGVESREFMTDSAEEEIGIEDDLALDDEEGDDEDVELDNEREDDEGCELDEEDDDNVRLVVKRDWKDDDLDDSDVDPLTRSTRGEINLEY